MKNLICIVVFIFFIFSISCCSNGNNNEKIKLTAVWTKDDWPPETMLAPLPNELKPYDIYVIAAKSNKLSSKHILHLYYYDGKYYIYDTFMKDHSAEAALKNSIIIDAKTGLIFTERQGVTH